MNAGPTEIPPRRIYEFITRRDTETIRRGIACAGAVAPRARPPEHPDRGSMRLNFVRAAVAGILLATGGLAAQPVSQDAPVEELRQARSLSRAFQHAAGRIDPSVVHISTRVVQTAQDFFGRPRRLEQTGVGSGVIVSADGYVLTNNHVIEGAQSVSVRLNDGRELPGEVIGTDPATDLAVVRVEAAGLVPAVFGDSDLLEVGEWVLAVGSPFGVFDNTVTAGIVSAKGRAGLATGRDERYEDFIQTDAAINPGNSGGPLVNLEGQVVGINSAIASRSGGSVGIGFAIPSTIARTVVDTVIRTGRVQRGWLGVSMTDLTPQRARELGLDVAAGVLVDEVVDGSPAEKAGLRPGDVVTSFNGRPTPDGRRLRNAIAFTAPGTVAEVDVMRGGKERTVAAEVADLYESRLAAVGGMSFQELGVGVRTVTPVIARELGYRGVEGVQVVEITPGSPAADAGLEAGDIIVSVARLSRGGGEEYVSTPTIEEFSAALARASPREVLRLRVVRGTMRGYVDVAPRP